MPKSHGKSSASSATRKKHAKKAAGPELPQAEPGKKKSKSEHGKKKEPRPKMYIPPVKPAPVQPDPLETTGLAHSLPPDLLVVLRSFGKKAQVTKIRALEELQAAWVDKARGENTNEEFVYILVEMLPVWMHHVSALFVHPSRRVRSLAASLHFSLLQIPEVRDQILVFLRQSEPASQVESALGTWLIAAYDIDRSVASPALASWNATISLTPAEHHLALDEHLRNSLVSFIQRTLLDPAGIYVYLNPPAPAAPPPSKKGITRGTSVPASGDQTPRTKAEEFEESEEDRKARLRVGALGATRWILEKTHPLMTDLVSLLSSPALWSCLHHADSCPFVDLQSFGFSQPVVRKSAWTLLQNLLSLHKDGIQPFLSVLSTAVLRSAWVETDSTVQSVMWQPLLTFLKEFPTAWELDRIHILKVEEPQDENTDSDGSMNSGDKLIEKSFSKDITHQERSSLAYQEFLQFLGHGCSGSPAQGYPTVVVVLSTIPSHILMSSSSPDSVPLEDFFTSFWAAIDGRALSSLHRATASAAFLSSLMECTLFIIRRIRNDEARSSSTSDTLNVQSSTSPGSASTAAILESQFKLIWDHLTSSKLKVEERAAARLIGQTLSSLYEMDLELFHAAWHTLSGMLVHTADEGSSSLVSSTFKVLCDRFSSGSGPKEAVEKLLKEVLNNALLQCQRAFRNLKSEGVSSPKDGFELLTSMLEHFRDGLFYDDDFSTRFDNTVNENAYDFIAACPLLLLSYLQHRKSEKQTLRVWHALLAGITAQPENIHHAIGPVLLALRDGLLPTHLKPASEELDVLAGRLLAGSSPDLELARRIMLAADFFISPEGFISLLHTVMSTFTLQVDLVIAGDEEPVLFAFESPLDILSSIFQHPPKMIHSIPKDRSSLISLLPNLFLFAYLLPECGINDHPTFVKARDLWNQWQQRAHEDEKAIVNASIMSQLRVLLRDTQVRPFPEDILRMASNNPPGLHLSLLSDVFPSPEELDLMLDILPSDAIDPSLAVMNPLIPPASAFSKKHISPPSFDRHGLSPYARVIASLLQFFQENRQLAKQNLWALRHFLALSIYADDFLSIPSAQSWVFELKAVTSSLSDIVLKIHQVTTYLLLPPMDEEWLGNALLTVMGEKINMKLDKLGQFVVDTINYAQKFDSMRDTRILQAILQHLLDDVDKSEADNWVQFARKIERSAPQTSMTITASITRFLIEPQRLDRYRNELAAALLGIPAKRANTEGLISLRKLAAIAPDPDSDVVFLPQLRAVNLVKACQDWVSSDEDINEEVESAMMLIFLHLAPILQNVPGAHWEFIFDVLESNLENSLITEDSALVALSRSLRLIIVLQDLTASNKSLRVDWQERQMSIFTMVRGLASMRLDTIAVSVPRSICRELLLIVIQDLPPSLVDHDTLPKMCHLITDASIDVQKMAYRLLKSAAKKRTEHLVIEAGIDTEDTFKAALPLELIDIVQRNINVAVENEEENIFGYLLSWMLLFDLFEDASFKVRASYVEQLRGRDIIAGYFIPCFLSLLGLDIGISKAFKLDIWSVDEFFIEYYDSGTDFSIPLFAAHLFYRALLTVPSLIHTWVLDCKDRQLTSAITAYTSQHFSPVIIRAELAHVKSSGAMAELADDSMSIKVAPAVNEVVASYLVDEHQLEIKLKIPSDWPLHKIEVKDMKRVGVDENRWRAWILAVQQTIWSHDGRIVDGLGLFKKNVTLHFEGQVECAICYSIISVMDGSLPRKPCKTCKNRFHAGCLYKWFNTSHSSSCPLCRSDII